MPKDELLNEAEKMILGLQEFEGKISLSREELKSWMVLFHQQLLHKANISVCCSADMIPPDWDALEKDGSLWPASACYICKSCGKLCEPIGIT
jgi:hypothetical protein